MAEMWVVCVVLNYLILEGLYLLLLRQQSGGNVRIQEYGMASLELLLRFVTQRAKEPLHK